MKVKFMAELSRGLIDANNKKMKNETPEYMVGEDETFLNSALKQKRRVGVKVWVPLWFIDTGRRSI